MTMPYNTSDMRRLRGNNIIDTLKTENEIKKKSNPLKIIHQEKQ